MRVTNSLFYKNTINNYQRNMQELYDTNAQIASGLKIQNSFEDSGVYVDTMRLNYEVATLEQVKESSSKAQTYTNNTDNVMNQFSDALDKFKTKLIQASNESNTETSLDALANELSSLRDHMISLGNTSINGQYLFSGTSFETKPLDANGNYSGNDGSMEALIGSGVKLPYNITGEDLFLGQDSDYSRILSTNVKMLDQTKLHPATMEGTEELSQEVYLNEQNSIRDMVGDSDSDATNDPNSMFYLSGRRTNGTTFSSQLEISSSSKIGDLLERIGQEYGNTSTNSVVDVTMNAHGQIEIKDLKNGNALLEMNIFGAVDRGAGVGTAGVANKADIDDLLAQKNVDIISFSKSNFKETNTTSKVGVSENIYSKGDFSLNTKFKHIDGKDVMPSDTLQSFMGSDLDSIVLNGTDTAGAAVAFTFSGITNTTTVQDLMTTIEGQFGNVSARMENGQMYIADNSGNTPSNFDMSLTSQDNTPANINGFSTQDSMNYERRGFEKDGNTLLGNVSQTIRDTNDYATDKTKLIEVAGVKTFDDISVAGDETTFNLSGINNSGVPFDAQIELTNDNINASSFTYNGSTYTVFDATGNKTKADDMTYRQLEDVVAMITSGSLPTDTNGTPGIQFDEYENAISTSKGAVEVGLDYKGKLEIHDKFNSKSPIEFSMFDVNADKSTTASALTFMANDAVKIEDPNIDFFKDLDEMIDSVRTGRFRMDGDDDDPRKMGIQNSLSKIDHIMDHVTKEHTKIGSYSNALMQASDRSELLSINVKTIRSEVIDVDIGEAYMKFNQLSNSYQAMLSASAKINSMSLLNYM